MDVWRCGRPGFVSDPIQVLQVILQVPDQRLAGSGFWKRDGGADLFCRKGSLVAGERRDLRGDGDRAGSALNGDWLFDDPGWNAAIDLWAIWVTGVRDSVHDRRQNKNQERNTPKIHSKPSYWGGHWKCR
jgi:hypothetical protein